MNWILGLIGAVAGASVANEHELFGAVVGFAVSFLLVSVHGLRGQVDTLGRKLAALELKPAAPDSVTPSTLRPAALDAVPRQAPPPLPDTSLPGVARDASAPRTPSGLERLVGYLKSWFTEGNVPVKIGVLVLLFGVASALKYAAALGYFNPSIEVRMAAIAGVAMLGLAFGWRERLRRPAFGLSLQGGALGVLLLTVFASFRLYGLLPPMLAFALVAVLVAGSALLAVLQANMALAVLGFLGGYLAPVLIATGSSNPVGLFAYYAVLNAAVFAISWRHSWRLLNLVGFAFTFGVGSAWGSKFYRPELFGTVEPFLILFFLSYIIIGLLYVTRQMAHRRPWVDGTLVFGTPLVAFPLQAAMLKDDRLGLAFSALLVALVYAALVYWLHRRRGERLLTEAYGALALGFATLAVPLAFSASTTASVWALEGAGVAWLGLRQQRNVPWLAGLALQLLGAGAFVLSLFDVHGGSDAQRLLLLNANWLGAAIIAFSGYALSLVHDRMKPRYRLPWLLFGWATFWWLAAGSLQLDLAQQSLGEWQFATLYLAVTAAGAILLRDALSWRRMNSLFALSAVLGFALVIAANDKFHAPVTSPTWMPWLAYAAAIAWGLWESREIELRSLAFSHLAVLWTLALAITLQLAWLADVQSLGQGWRFLAWAVPVGAASLVLWRRPEVLAWPRAKVFEAYRNGWFLPALALMALAFATGLACEGSAVPLAYVPVLNPVDLALLGTGLLWFALIGNFTALQPLQRAWPLAAIAFITFATLRAVHHAHGEPWSAELLQSGFSQASLTIVWSLAGVAACVVGSRRRNRQVWIGGALLMVVVLLKLPTVDRHYMGNLPGIVSFLSVGLLLVVVGYLAPSPPRLLAPQDPA